MLDRKIGVTGGTGMLGRHVLHQLSVNDTSYTHVSRYEWNLDNWNSCDKLKNTFRGCNAIIHCAAHLPQDYILNSSTYETVFNVNVRSPFNLGLYALKNNVHLVYFSGSTVYEDPYAIKIKENAPKVVNGLGGFYGYSKLLAESSLLHLVKKGLRLTILRPSSIYGYGLGSDKLVSKLLNTAKSKKTTTIKNPKYRINLVHAYDCASAGLSAIQHEAYGIFNVAASKSVSMLELAQTSHRISRKSEKYITISGSFDDSRICFDLDCTAAKQNFNYRPEVDIVTGLELMIRDSCYEKLSV